MEIIIKILLLGAFGCFVFFYQTLSPLGYGILLAFMLCLMGAFYVVSYWVSRKDISRLRSLSGVGTGDGHSFFGVRRNASVPGGERYTRGRLLVTADIVTLYRRLPVKERVSSVTCESFWSCRASDIVSLEAAGESMRRGITFTLQDGETMTFLSYRTWKQIDVLGELLHIATK